MKQPSNGSSRERELHRIARRCMAGERAGHSLQAALVNEAYLRLVDVQHVNWQDRAPFPCDAGQLMRRVLWTRHTGEGLSEARPGLLSEAECKGLVLIVGPTSSGKSQLLHDIHKSLSGQPRRDGGL